MSGACPCAGNSISAGKNTTNRLMIPKLNITAATDKVV